ncbi:MAG: 2-dehydropantoate 2-reductase [Pseudomonadota bacterium]
MNIVIVGPGAMGCLFAGMLHRDGHTVWLLARHEDKAAAIVSKGLVIEKGDTIWHMPFMTVTANPAIIGIADVLIFFVKAYSTGDALHTALPVISENTSVITLQNGLGNTDKIGAVVPGDQILAGTTAHGATLLGDGHVRHAGMGETILGAVTPAGYGRALAVQKIFMDAGINTIVSNAITSALWGKLLVNAGINPLTAIMSIKNGRILDCPHLCSIMHRAVEEVCLVSNAMGITLPFPEPVKKVEEVCRATSENISSMLQDINAGRKTEIDYINGAVVLYGRKVAIATPINSLLTALVNSLKGTNAQA